MAEITRFEDLEVWQMAYNHCLWLNSVVERSALKQDFGLRNQVENASGSIMDKIAEGFERQGNNEFINFLFIAKASAGEARSQLNRLRMKNYIE